MHQFYRILRLTVPNNKLPPYEQVSGGATLATQARWCINTVESSVEKKLQIRYGLPIINTYYLVSLLSIVSAILASVAQN